jgi:NAD(P)-dependent dehydrogenase (short-subunit alcohol dehydrogenase family)
MSTILVTGAGRGIGLELARQYAADGWRVIGTVRDANATPPGANVQLFQADVTDRGAIARLKEALGGAPIDVLVCNAGIHGPQGMRLGTLDYAAWEKVLRVNLLGAAAMVEALVDNVAASERRTIALMSSRLGSISEASSFSLLYSTSKAALNMLAKSLSVTLAGRGITVVALNPGWVRTDMGGKGAALTPEQSVSALRKVLDGLGPASSGRFFNYDGTEIPW